MPEILVSDANGQAQRIQAERNSDNTLSPRYGLSDNALAALQDIRTAVEDGPTGGPTSQNQNSIIALLSGISAKLDAVSAGLDAIGPPMSHEPADLDEELSGVAAIFIGTAGDVVVTLNGTDATYACVSGQILPLAGVTMIKASGTTATDIIVWKR